jgi:transposase
MEWLHQDEPAPPKQRHTAKRIYDRLTEEYEFTTGGESTVRSCVRRLRKTSTPKAFVPLEFPSRKFAQFDWGEVEYYPSRRADYSASVLYALHVIKKVFI